jgi:uncharacterized membrane protein YeiH
MSQYLFSAFEMLGVIAFAVSGAITAIKKGMDIFGVCILGLTTAVGGGIIRDLVLGNTPPVTFRNPHSAIVAILVCVITFIITAKSPNLRKKKTYELSMLLMDSIGLGVFTVSGINTAYNMNSDYRIFLLVFVGVVTGVGGGVIRDMMAGNPPSIFVKHFYASASLIGALTYIYSLPYIPKMYAMFFGTAIIIVLRLSSVYFDWNLPKIESSDA